MAHHFHPFQTLVWVRDADGYTTGNLLEVVTLLVNPGQSALIHNDTDDQGGALGFKGGRAGGWGWCVPGEKVQVYSKVNVAEMT